MARPCECPFEDNLPPGASVAFVVGFADVTGDETALPGARNGCASASANLLCSDSGAISVKVLFREDRRFAMLENEPVLGEGWSEESLLLRGKSCCESPFATG